MTNESCQRLAPSQRSYTFASVKRVLPNLHCRAAKAGAKANYEQAEVMQRHIQGLQETALDMERPETTKKVWVHPRKRVFSTPV